MPILRQILEALACSIEDFFSVPWQSVVCLLFIVVGLVYYAYSRTVYGYLNPPDQRLRILAWIAIWGGIGGTYHFGKRRW